MHTIILAASADPNSSLPHILLPQQGRSRINFLLEDILLQKEITSTIIVTNRRFYPLIKKHIQNAFPESSISVSENKAEDELKKIHDDILILSDTISTSLKLQDFIRFYTQFKGITTGAYEGVSSGKSLVIDKNKVVQIGRDIPDQKGKCNLLPYFIVPRAHVSLLISYFENDDVHSLSGFADVARNRGTLYAFNMGTANIDKFE